MRIRSKLNLEGRALKSAIWKIFAFHLLRVALFLGGAIYVYDRKRCTWLWVDFEDRNYGGYSPSEFDSLPINQCHFFGLVESPALLESPVQLVSPGQRPRFWKDSQFEEPSRKDHSAAFGRNANFRLQIAESKPSTNSPL